ncbi:MAG TPA: hypothetical protein VFS62_10860 [Chloroflexota bacterium]|jgi:hypothetical protein|nr:hypothetical protein [Chloroflexota bacterium]
MKHGGWESGNEQLDDQLMLIDPRTNKPTMQTNRWAFSEQELYELLQTAGRVQIDYRRKGRIPRA